MSVLKYGDEGPDVLYITALLEQQGLLEEPKNEYDAEVRRAVRTWQTYNIDARGRPLSVDGKVGPLTLWSLETWDQSAQFTPVPESMYEMPEGGTDLGRMALQVALEEMAADAGEVGSNNQGPWVAKYHNVTEEKLLNHNWPWCSAFVSWCVHEAASRLEVEPPFKRIGLARKVHRVMKKKGHTYSLTEQDPQPGDLVVWRRGTSSWQGHIGFVHSYANGILYTIEGNRGRYPSKVRAYDYVASEMEKLIGFVRLP